MDHIQKTKRKINPEEKANFLSKLSFIHTFPLFKKGTKDDLEDHDLYEVLSNYKSKNLGDKLEHTWMKESQSGTKTPSIFKILWLCYGLEYILLGLIQLVVKTIIIVLQPNALAKYISYFDKPNNMAKNDAYFYAALIIILNLLNCVYVHNYALAVAGLGIKVRTAFCSFIYRKALRLSPTRLSDISVGKIVTLMTKDVHSFELFLHFANDLWIGVIKTFVIFFILYKKIGLASVAGMAFFLIMLPLQAYMGKMASKLRTKMCKKTDDRLQLTQEILSAIKIIKIYTWESFFNRKVAERRKKEIKSMHTIFILKFIILQLGSLSSKLAFYLLLMTYISLGNHITAEVVYFVESLLLAVNHTMGILFPMGITQAAELSASAARISNVLQALEVNNNVKQEAHEKILINLKNVSVDFKGKEILHSISLKLETGLTLITGPVGCGKSFLLKTILQDFEPSNGGLQVKGRVSYASQEPWLFPSSIRQNILFGAKYDKVRYEEVLKVCALVYDLELLSAGDQTIVEDKGINLSKGQQVRINLARAIYQENDIYLLDDCLAALDAHVSAFIFKECFLNYLQNKLVVFVSHNVDHVKEVDNVVIMHNGSVSSCVKSSEITEKQILEEIIDDGGKAKESLEQDDVDENSKLITETVKEKKVYQEEKIKGKVNLNVYLKYAKFGGGFFTFLLLVVIFVSAHGVNTFSDKLLSKWVNLEQKFSNLTYNNASNISNENQIENDRSFYQNLYSGMIIVSVILSFSSIVSLFAVARRASIKLHEYMMEHIIGATMQFFDQNFIGNILNRFSKDLTSIDEHLPFVIFQIFYAFLVIISVIYLIYTVSTLFLIPTVILIGIAIMIRRYYLPVGRSLKRLDAASRSPVVGYLNATLEGLTTIRAFKTEDVLRDEFDKHQDLYTSASYMFQSTMRAFALSLDAVTAFFIACVVLRFIVFDDVFLAGSVGLAITQAFRMIGSVQWAIRQWAELENSMTSVERVLEYTTVKQESTQGRILDNWPSKGEVQYKNVYLSYNNSNEYVLKDVNFIAHPKEKIGIVGRTGAGKSSILSSLFRLYNVQGSITIDGVDIKTLSMEFVRKHISIIPQDPVLFTGSIRDNIDPEQEYSDEQIWTAIEVVNLKNIVPSLDFQISENGSNFSVGQRQLICVARAVIQNNKIIVLDEATANMDPETDAIVHETIHKNFDSCTVITIAHKLHSVLDSDKVVVMDKGEIVEYDEPINLLQNQDGIFYQMVKKAGLLPSTP